MSQIESRRRFIRLTVAGATAALAGHAAAQPAKVSETSPQGQALGYKADATKAPQRNDAAAFCENCEMFSGRAGGEGPCAVFGGQLVAAKGWCTAWVKRQ